MKKIDIKNIKNIKIGSAENQVGGTGCTVLLCENGMAAGLDVRGGGPAARESELLKPTASAQIIHAVVLGGGSAYGLDAAGGVMQYLEEQGIGMEVGPTRVPLVCQSDIFDLTVGDAFIRPDKAMGYEACKNAFLNNYQDGNYGVGTGASVGKMKGMDYCMKSGIGSYAVSVGDLMVGAVVVVNALGDIFDYRNGSKIAGMLANDKKTFESCEDMLYQSYERKTNRFVENTTIGAIITNGKFNKSQLCKIAGMTQNGYAKSICPVHTSADGDSIYALSVGDVEADIDMVGTLSAKVMAEAIMVAVKSAESAYGLPAYSDMNEISKMDT